MHHVTSSPTLANQRGIYNIPLDYRFLRHIRLLRNLTTYQLAKYMNLDQATLSKLENETINFTPYYESKLKQAIRTLQITNPELLAIYKAINFSFKN